MVTLKLKLATQIIAQDMTRYKLKFLVAISRVFSRSHKILWTNVLSAYLF